MAVCVPRRNILCLLLLLSSLEGPGAGSDEGRGVPPALTSCRRSPRTHGLILDHVVLASHPLSDIPKMTQHPATQPTGHRENVLARVCPVQVSGLHSGLELVAGRGEDVSAPLKPRWRIWSPQLDELL